jgi:hypothetical protein
MVPSGGATQDLTKRMICVVTFPSRFKTYTDVATAEANSYAAFPGQWCNGVLAAALAVVQHHPGPGLAYRANPQSFRLGPAFDIGKAVLIPEEWPQRSVLGAVKPSVNHAAATTNTDSLECRTAWGWLNS